MDLQQQRAYAIRILDNLLERIREAERDLAEAEARLAGLFPMRVVYKKKKCSNKRCRCALGVLHGPYPYLVEYRDGKKVEHYLGKGWQPPEGMVPPDKYKDLLEKFQACQERRERLLGYLDEAVQVMRRI